MKGDMQPAVSLLRARCRNVDYALLAQVGGTIPAELRLVEADEFTSWFIRRRCQVAVKPLQNGSRLIVIAVAYKR